MALAMAAAIGSRTHCPLAYMESQTIALPAYV